MQSERNITLSYTGGASYCDLKVNIFIFCIKLVHFDDMIYGLVCDVDTVFGHFLSYIASLNIV